MGNPACWTQLHARVHQTLKRDRLLEPHERVLLAISGGQDSLCLLQLLCDLQPKRWGWQLAIAHCDHRWSGDEDLADRVRQIAGQWELPFHQRTAPPLPATEAAAREWRYRALVEIAQSEGFSAIATGHTQSDRAETLLYNLVRGSGPDGLQALGWQRSLAAGIRLVRPLLGIGRAETGTFCQQNQLPVQSDPANRDRRYARNRIRADLVPYLQAQLNPNVETTLAQTAEIFRAEVAHLEREADALLQQALPGEPSPPQRLDRRPLHSAPLALQRRVMRAFLQRVLARAPTFEQIEELTRLIEAPNRTRTASLPVGAAARPPAELPRQRPAPAATHAEVDGDWICLKR
ncbi:MAG: tRNA lysidine(34) synthetase TilS [Cyanobacteria bacterium QS_8_64_29]|nr:MAG: tRNA lysidine(34) synthetase TilS [Cyanobacteria bacterium QS_8_64_29]